MKKRILLLALSVIMAFSAFSCKRGGSETGTQIEETESTRVRDDGSEKNPPKVSEGGIPADRVIVDAEKQAKYYCPDVFYTTAVPCRINIDNIAAHSECSPFESHIVSGVLDVNEFAQ